MRCSITCGLITAIGLIAGCDRGSSPLSPSRLEGGVQSQIAGHVTDTQQQPVSGAAVEVVGGPAAGTATTTKDDGSFLLVVPTTVSTVTLRVRKIGLRVLTLNATPGIPDVRIALPPFQSAALSGSYTVTISADGACTQIPRTFLTRTYSAMIKPESELEFSVALTGANLVNNSDMFWGTVAGDQARFDVTSLYAMNTLRDDLPIVERLADNEYLAFEGRTSAISVDGPFVQMAWEGSISYCSSGDPSPSPLYKCAASCSSSQHRLTLRPQ